MSRTMADRCDQVCYGSLTFGLMALAGTILALSWNEVNQGSQGKESVLANALGIATIVLFVLGGSASVLSACLRRREAPRPGNEYALLEVRTGLPSGPATVTSLTGSPE